MIRQRLAKNSSDKKQSATNTNSLFTMRSRLYPLLIILVMAVIAMIPYITFSNKWNFFAFRDVGDERELKFDEEIESDLFFNITNFPEINTRKIAYTRRVFDERSKLDIKVLFIGVKKCGTTALKAFAGAHPDIIVANSPHVCRPKVFRSYKKIEVALATAKTQRKVALVENNECLHNFRFFDRLKRPEKIVLLLCDPTLRAYSDYKHIVRTFSYKGQFGLVVSNALSLMTAHKNDVNFGEYMSKFRYQGHLDYSIVSVGVYYEYLKEYYNRYKPEDILILCGAELKQTPRSVMYKLETFLGVSHYLDRSKFVKNTDTGFYCVKQLNGSPRCIGLANTQIFPPPDPNTLEKLKKFYHPYNEKLYQLINRTFMWL